MPTAPATSDFLGKKLSVRGVKALSGPIESEPDAKANGKEAFMS
jgi:hypothetical protein